MRLWSLHPSYLDARGLVALWREGLLARAVLKGQTSGYRRHPQLDRFKSLADPVAAIDNYLWEVYEESVRRGYHFDMIRLGTRTPMEKTPVTLGQLHYEFDHLKRKLEKRDAERFRKAERVDEPLPHPLFRVIPGEIEPWERGNR